MFYTSIIIANIWFAVNQPIIGIVFLSVGISFFIFDIIDKRKTYKYEKDILESLKKDLENLTKDN